MEPSVTFREHTPEEQEAASRWIVDLAAKLVEKSATVEGG